MVMMVISVVYILELVKIRLKKPDFYGCNVLVEGGFMKIVIPK